MAITPTDLREWVNAGSAAADADLQECVDEAAALTARYLAKFGDNARSAMDAVTISDSTKLSSAKVRFTLADKGRAITGGGIPADTTIAFVVDPCTVTLSAPATATASSVVVTVAGDLPPDTVIDRATKEVAADLWHRRKAPNGILNQQFAQGGSGDLGAVPIRISRDPLASARPILDGWVTPLGFA